MGQGRLTVVNMRNTELVLLFINDCSPGQVAPLVSGSILDQGTYNGQPTNACECVNNEQVSLSLSRPLSLSNKKDCLVFHMNNCKPTLPTLSARCPGLCVTVFQGDRKPSKTLGHNSLFRNVPPLPRCPKRTVRQVDNLRMSTLNSVLTAQNKKLKPPHPEGLERGV